MKKQLFTLSIIAALTSGLVACNSADTAATTMAPGTYEHKSSSVDAAGTKTTTKQQTVVGEDVNGNKSAVVKTKTTQDPKGLMNKSTTKSTTVSE